MRRERRRGGEGGPKTSSVKKTTPKGARVGGSET